MKTKQPPGTAIDAENTMVNRRTKCMVVVEFELGGRDKKIAELNLKSLKAGPPPRPPTIALTILQGRDVLIAPVNTYIQLKVTAATDSPWVDLQWPLTRK